MVSIADHLAALNLSQYLPRFSTEGVTTLAPLLALSDQELEARLASIGMLKGHAIKFRISLDPLKQGKPAPLSQSSQQTPPPKSLPQKASLPAMRAENPLMVETQRITSKLVEIDSLKQAISTSKEAILRMDVEAYRHVLEQIEMLQKSLRVEPENDQNSQMEGVEESAPADNTL